MSNEFMITPEHFSILSKRKYFILSEDGGVYLFDFIGSKKDNRKIYSEYRKMFIDVQLHHGAGIILFNAVQRNRLVSDIRSLSFPADVEGIIELPQEGLPFDIKNKSFLYNNAAFFDYSKRKIYGSIEKFKFLKPVSLEDL